MRLSSPPILPAPRGRCSAPISPLHLAYPPRASGQVRLHGDNATRRGAADALGERVALLQEQLASAQLDLEQSRHAALSERAQLESELRERQEDLEVTRWGVGRGLGAAVAGRATARIRVGGRARVRASQP